VTRQLTCIIAGRQLPFFQPDQHDDFDHFRGGFTSFHREEEETRG